MLSLNALLTEEIFFNSDSLSFTQAKASSLPLSFIIAKTSLSIIAIFNLSLSYKLFKTLYLSDGGASIILCK